MTIGVIWIMRTVDNRSILGNAYVAMEGNIRNFSGNRLKVGKLRLLDENGRIQGVEKGLLTRNC